MRINAITANYNAKSFTRNSQQNNRTQVQNNQTSPSFCGENKKHQSNSLLRGAQGLMLLSALSMTPSCSDVIGGKDKFEINLEHNIMDKKKDTSSIYIPPIIIERPDTVRDTLKVPEFLPGKDSIIYKDSIVYRDTIIRDTIHGEDVYIPYEKPLNPEISDKDKENMEEIGIEVEGDGDYVLASHFFAEYEGYDEARKLNMDLCSRDGSKYVYNAIRTGYSYNPDEGTSEIQLGKEQQFVRYEYTLSDDKQSLFVRTFVPKDEISISNDRGERSWEVFDGQLKQHSKWKELQTERGEIEIKNVRGGMLAILSGGVKVGEATKGNLDQSVKYVNNYEGERRFSDVQILTGGKYEPFPDPDTQDKYEQGLLK